MYSIKGALLPFPFPPDEKYHSCSTKLYKSVCHISMHGLSYYSLIGKYGYSGGQK